MRKLNIQTKWPGKLSLKEMEHLRKLITLTTHLLGSNLKWTHLQLMQKLPCELFQPLKKKSEKLKRWFKRLKR